MNAGNRFDDLRIRRERKDTKQKVTGSRRRNPVSNGRSDKIACLLFSATFKNEKETRELKIKSQPITLGKDLMKVIMITL